MSTETVKPKVQVKIFDPRLDADKALVYGSKYSAAIDLRACIQEPITLQPNEWQLIPAGLAIYLEDPELAGLILPRSGMGHKHGIVLGNLVGLIDADYQGQLQMSIWNRSNSAFTIQPLDRVAQYMVVPVVHPEFTIVDDFTTSTDRGATGFGNSGVK